MSIVKKDKQYEYWPRLTKEKVKNAFLKTDFSKWVDEDEQDGAPVEDPELDMGGGMGGGMGGPGGMDFEKVNKSIYLFSSATHHLLDDGADGRHGRYGWYGWW